MAKTTLGVFDFDVNVAIDWIFSACFATHQSYSIRKESQEPWFYFEYKIKKWKLTGESYNERILQLIYKGC